MSDDQGRPAEGATMEIRTGTSSDHPILVEHFLALWASYGVPPEHMQPDAEQRVLNYIRDAQENRSHGLFLAVVDGKAIGSAACQLYVAPFPEVMLPQHRLFGYIWSVYVDPAYRRQGVARQLVARAVEHLRGLGCTTAVLHSSEAGEALYRQLGFEIAREMRMKLR